MRKGPKTSPLLYILFYKIGDIVVGTGTINSGLEARLSSMDCTFPPISPWKLGQMLGEAQPKTVMRNSTPLPLSESLGAAPFLYQVLTF